ncbi:hypothetical protein Bca4012_097637 [Brassica carinata]
MLVNRAISELSSAAVEFPKYKQRLKRKMELEGIGVAVRFQLSMDHMALRSKRWRFGAEQSRR